MYQNRFYRHHMGQKRFKAFNVSYKDTDLWVGTDPASFHPDMHAYILQLIQHFQQQITEYEKKHQGFISSFSPEKVKNAPDIVTAMAEASKFSEVGPMASVAGAFAQFIGLKLQDEFSFGELIIENGGDLFITIQQPLLVALFAGNSPLSGKVGVMVKPEYSPLGVCTSAATVGHSFSYGKADAVMISCRNTLLADAYATAYGNRIKTGQDISIVLEEIKQKSEILAALIVLNDKMGIAGKFELKILKNEGLNPA